MVPTKDIHSPIHSLLSQRWSPRSFDENRSVDPQILDSLFEAARWSPSCFNEQPWHFIIGLKSDRSDYEAILSCLVEFNQNWAKSAPILMIAVANTRFQRGGKVNAHALYDLGAAVASLTLEATSRNLFVHQMAGFDPEKARGYLGIPEHYEAVTAIALGYLGDPEKLPEGLREREYATPERKTIGEFVHRNRWS